jgi:cytoskeletal protein RodZ
MLRPHDLVGRFAILILGTALVVGAQAPPSKSTPQAPAKSAPTAAAPAKAPAPAAAPAKAPAKATQAAKQAAPKPKPPAAQKPSKPPAKPEAQAKKKEEEAPSAASAAAHRRDPFLTLISAATANIAVRLPPGKAGLQVSTVRVDGIVRSQNGMLVVVTNPQGRTYFLHQGDRLFDGRVEAISMDAVTFQESGKDPFGKVIERTVVKRIYPSAGEQQ